MQFLGKKLPKIRLTYALWSWPPILGNPGASTSNANLTCAILPCYDRAEDPAVFGDKLRDAFRLVRGVLGPRVALRPLPVQPLPLHQKRDVRGDPHNTRMPGLLHGEYPHNTRMCGLLHGKIPRSQQFMCMFEDFKINSSLPIRIPPRTGKPGKMGRHFPVREFWTDWKS